MINFLDPAQGLGTNTVPTQGLNPDPRAIRVVIDKVRALVRFQLSMIARVRRILAG